MRIFKLKNGDKLVVHKHYLCGEANKDNCSWKITYEWSHWNMPQGLGWQDDSVSAHDRNLKKAFLKLKLAKLEAEIPRLKEMRTGKKMSHW